MKKWIVLLVCVSLAGCAEEDLSAEDVAARDAGRVVKPGSEDADAGEPAAAPHEPKHDDSAGRKNDAGPSPVKMKPTPAAADSDAGTQDAGEPAADGDIETVAMDVDYTIGGGGGVYPIPRPVILFKDGSACRDMSFVVSGLSEADHKKKYPNTWLLWRTVDNKLQVGNGTKWRVLDFQQRYAPNPTSFTLDQTYTHLDSFSSGDTVAFAQQSVRFTKDHKMLWGSVAGVTGPDTAVGSIPPDRRGTYKVDGYTIEINWDDGKTTKTSFVWSAEDPEAVYISGGGFVALSS